MVSLSDGSHPQGSTKVSNNKRKGDDKTTKYEITFLRGRKSGSHIEIIENMVAEGTEEVVEKAIKRALKTGWHVEKVRQLE